jgi:penicillin-binding protein 1C
LLIPTELDGSRGKAVVEAAHRDPVAHIHWDLDGSFMGTTTGDHRMAMDPPDGPHVLTLTDDHGRSIRHSFVVVSRDER